MCIMTPGSQSRRSQIESYGSQLGWNTYLLFNSYSELCVENQWRGGRKHCFVNICSLAMLYSLVGDRSWGGAESFIQGQLKLHPFPRQDVSWSNMHDTFWHVLSTRYFYVLFLWTIAVSDFSDFHPLEIHKNLGLPLSTITVTVKSHTDNHFYNILIWFKYYTVWN